MNSTRLQTSQPSADGASLAWRFVREATAFRAARADTLRFYPDRPAGQRFTIERTAQLHEGQVDRLQIDGAIVPLNGLTVLNARERMRDVVTADAMARLEAPL